MYGFKKVREVDDSGYKITYEKYRDTGWVQYSLNVKSEERVEQFMDKQRTDFNMRVVSIEKRVMIYERWESF